MEFASIRFNMLVAAALMLLGGMAQAQILPQWSRTLAAQHTLDDGVVDRRGWSVGTDGGMALATAAGSTAWPDNSVVLRRYDPSALRYERTIRLDSLPRRLGHVRSLLLAMDSGTMDLPGDFDHTGFVGAIDPAGNQRVLHAAYTDTPFLRTTHDAAGTVYVQTDAGSVRAIDPANGALRWEQPGREIAAAAAGVVLVDPAPAGAGPTTLTAVSADGTVQWTQSLDIDRQAAVHGGDRRDGRSRLLLQPGRSAECSKTPVTVTLDASGSLVRREQSCRLGTGSQALYSLSAHPAGVLALSATTVTALDSNGEQRWDFSLCLTALHRTTSIGP
ncbi:hypothetical protein DFR29_111147 [Tahibacter aquaticus]|uniref:Pyrroloquinoline-quinone binding quinoprotein n=1 Tax=Tahibacter aquaticus TaxID=520092 RepID=A0A4R6YSQ3_9GAMM|nr:PQQ-binding-like beta-propeller repeat protein [Tahibacter aquaticus]TDR41233.1 hypothetical protein DFR29_111147 [Tahibacter aquaticus]